MWLEVLLLLISIKFVHGLIDALQFGDAIYAQKALEAWEEQLWTGCLCGVACKDGVLLAKLHAKEEDNIQFQERNAGRERETKRHAVERTRSLDPESPVAFGKSLFNEDNILVAISGWQADVTYLSRHIQEACQKYQKMFGTAMSARQVAEEVASFLHTLSVEDSNTRSLVVSVLIAGTSRTLRPSEHNALKLVQTVVKGEPSIRLERGEETLSGIARSCIYKVDCAGVMRQFSAAMTGALVSDDLRYLALQCDGGDGIAGEQGPAILGKGSLLERLSNMKDEWSLLTTEQALSRLTEDVGFVAEHISAAL